MAYIFFFLKVEDIFIVGGVLRRARRAVAREERRERKERKRTGKNRTKKWP